MIKTQQDKEELHQCIALALEANHQVAVAAAQQAYETATSKETKAENKYDTFGLEASYLAHGQSKRVDESLSHIKQFKELPIVLSNNEDEVALGQLVLLEDDEGLEHYYFMSPAAGGLKLEFKNQSIVLITPHAPLGKALMNRIVDDSIELEHLKGQFLTIKAVY